MAARLFAAIAIVFGANQGLSACEAPRYGTGRILEHSPSSISLQISIRLKDFAPEKLICLAGELKLKYAGRRIAASIFSSSKAARGYVLSSIERVPEFVKFGSKQHGLYIYDKEKHEEYLLIVPDPLDRTPDSPLATRIDLPVNARAGCRIEINARCLLEFQHVDRSFLGSATASGEVTLSGAIRANGVMSGLAVVAARANPPERSPDFAAFAIKNISTWRFEAAKREETVRITYYFDITDGGSVGDGSVVQFRLPNEVRIQTTVSR